MATRQNLTPARLLIRRGERPRPRDAEVAQERRRMRLRRPACAIPQPWPAVNCAMREPRPPHHPGPHPAPAAAAPVPGRLGTAVGYSRPGRSRHSRPPVRRRRGRGEPGEHDMPATQGKKKGCHGDTQHRGAQRARRRGTQQQCAAQVDGGERAIASDATEEWGHRTPRASADRLGPRASPVCRALPASTGIDA
jgi:hypothetical protein